MEMTDVIIQGFFSAMRQIGQMALILIPIVIFLEILRDLNIVDSCARFFAPMMRAFRLPGEAAIPIVVGLIFGIVYGAGVLIQSAKDGSLTPKELTVIGLFLSLNHAIIEDPLLFTLIGANYPLLQLIRFAASIIITALFAIWLLPPLMSRSILAPERKPSTQGNP